MEQQNFSTGQVIKLTGVTARQLDYWAWTNFVTPSSLGRERNQHRRYTYQDVLKIKTIKTLHAQGIGTRFIRKVEEQLRDIAADPLTQLRLVGIGGELFVCYSDTEVARATDGQLAFIVLDIAKVTAQLQGQLCQVPPIKPGPRKKTGVA